MEKDNKNAYSEVIEILKFLDDEEKLEALPIEMLEVLKSKANPEYKPQISKDIPFEEQNLQPETLQILSWIATKYWSNELQETEQQNIEEKDKLDIELPKEESESKEDNVEDTKEENNLPILHREIKWYEKIKEKILAFLDRIFKREKKEGNTI